MEFLCHRPEESRCFCGLYCLVGDNCARQVLPALPVSLPHKYGEGMEFCPRGKEDSLRQWPCLLDLLEQRGAMKVMWPVCEVGQEQGSPW